MQAQKKALRELVSLRLSKLRNIEEQSAAVAARVIALPQFRQCTSISCYLNMPSKELDTSLIVAEILRAGKTLFVPRTEKGDPVMRFLKIHDQEDLQSLLPGLWGIRQPELLYKNQSRINADEAGVELILVPGVAFDASMARLGHGKGYYDRFISRCVDSERPKPLLVALSLREQLLGVGEVPCAGHDWKMDLIVTPDQVIGSSGK